MLLVAGNHVITGQSFPLDFPSRSLWPFDPVPDRTTSCLYHTDRLHWILSCRQPLLSLSLHFVPRRSIQKNDITMSPTATRAVLRQSQALIRRTAVRHNSSNTANKAKETVNQATSKATEGLSKVSSSAGPAISGAAQNVGNSLRKLGGPAAKTVGFIERKNNRCLWIGFAFWMLFCAVENQEGSQWQLYCKNFDMGG